MRIRRQSARRSEDRLWRPEYNQLAVYNAEVARGIVHTPEYKKRMARAQREYDEAIRRQVI